MGERGTSPQWARAVARVALGATAAAAVIGVGACGGGGERQDADDPSGEFQVAVTQAQFPNRQRLAETNDLELTVQNIGDEQIPELAVTIETDEGADEPFSIRLDEEGLANPNRPVWILEEDYPKLREPGVDAKELDKAPSAGADVAHTNTFGFGPLPPDDTRTFVWRVTAIRAGTYRVSYELAASLSGDAEATTADGGAVKGEFLVTITDKPPKATVDEQGRVQIEE